jgi:hypothetical protein
MATVFVHIKDDNGEYSKNIEVFCRQIPAAGEFIVINEQWYKVIFIFHYGYTDGDAGRLDGEIYVVERNSQELNSKILG